MGLVENIKSLFGNKKNFKVEHNVKNASIYLEWNFKAEYFKIYHKIKDKWIEYCITYDCAARIDFCPVGISIFKVCAFNAGEMLVESGEISVKINTLEISYAQDDEKVHLFWNKTGGTDGYKIYKNQVMHFIQVIKKQRRMKFTFTVFLRNLNLKSSLSKMLKAKKYLNVL